MFFVLSFIIHLPMLRREIISSFLRKIKWNDEILVDIVDKTFSFLSEEDLFYTLTPGVGSIFTPFVFRDMKKVAKLVIDTLSKNENILIFGDKDADGIIGTFILKDFLERFKLIIGSKSEIFFEVPEGDDVYGIVPEVVEDYEGKVSLIITVDNGISAVEAVKKASEKNIKFIITDHHEVYDHEVLKLADAVINPKVEGKYGVFLSGTGVVFFTVVGILLYYFYKNLYLVSFFDTENPEEVEVLEIEEFYPYLKKINRRDIEGFILSLPWEKRNLVFIDEGHIDGFRKHISEILKSKNARLFKFDSIVRNFGFSFKFEEMSDKLELMQVKKSLKLFALIFYVHVFGKKEIKEIIYDYIPLVGVTVLSDNMLFLSYNRFFIQEAVKRISKVRFDSVRYILSYTVGENVTCRSLVLRLIPFINSAGRMGQASKMVRLLLSNELKEIERLTREIDVLNNERRRIVENYIKSLSSEIKERRVIIDSSIDRGLISLISTRIASQVEYPIVVMSNGGNGEIFSGSARFSKGNVFEIIKSLSHYLESFGGHKKAAGFVISKSKIEDFVKEFSLLDYEKFREEYNPIAKMDILKFKKLASFFYYLEPLNDDLKPVLEDEMILQDYKVENYTKQCYVMLKDEWFPMVYENDKIREWIGEKVKVIFSYEYRYDNKLQETLFVPKILEIRKC